MALSTMRTCQDFKIYQTFEAVQITQESPLILEPRVEFANSDASLKAREEYKSEGEERSRTWEGFGGSEERSDGEEGEAEAQMEGMG